MVTKIKSGGAGSSGGLVNYLEKEERGQWFNQDQEGIGPLEVTSSLDANKKNLGIEDDKLFQVILSPSEKELAYINNDPEKLQEYTRKAMEAYAENFKKGIGSEDLLWFAKIEHERKYTYQDAAVQMGVKEKGESKEGDQSHVHVLVSRTENLERFNEQKKAGELDHKTPYKLSPTTPHRNTEQGAVKGGFDRKAFIETCEKVFDQEFNYERQLDESFKYANTMQHGSDQERLDMRMAALSEEREQRQNSPNQAQIQKQEVKQEHNYNNDLTL